MDDKSRRSTTVNSIIDKLRSVITKNSDNDVIRRPITVMPTAHGHDLAEPGRNDIDQEITDLENLIKRLQAEIAEMTAKASKPLQEYNPEEAWADEDDDGKPSDKEHHFKITKQGPNLYPVALRDDDTIADEASIFERRAITINAFDITGPQKDHVDDVTRNFSMLWDDTPLSDCIEDDDVVDTLQPDICNNPPKTLNDPSLEPHTLTLKSDENFLKNISGEYNTLDSKIVANVIETDKNNVIIDSTTVPEETTECSKNVKESDNVKDVPKSKALSSNSEVPLKYDPKPMTENVNETTKVVNKPITFDSKDSSSNTSIVNPVTKPATNVSMKTSTEDVKASKASNEQVIVGAKQDNTIVVPKDIENKPSESTAKLENPVDPKLPKKDSPSLLRRLVSKTGINFDRFTSSPKTPAVDTSPAPDFAKVDTSVTKLAKGTQDAPTLGKDTIAKSDSNSLLQSVNRKIRNFVGRDSSKSINKDIPTRSQTDLTNPQDTFQGNDDKDIKKATAGSGTGPILVVFDEPKTENKSTDVPQDPKNQLSKSSVTEGTTTEKKSSKDIFKSMKKIIPNIKSKHDVKSTKSEETNELIKTVINKPSEVGGTKLVQHDLQESKIDAANTTVTAVPISIPLGIDTTENENLIVKKPILKNATIEQAGATAKSSVNSAIPRAFSIDLTKDMKEEVAKVDAEVAGEEDAEIATEDVASETDDESQIEEDGEGYGDEEGEGDEDLMDDEEDLPNDTEEVTANNPQNIGDFVTDADSYDDNTYDVD